MIIQEYFLILKKQKKGVLEELSKFSLDWRKDKKFAESKKEEFPPQQIKKNSIIAIFKVQASSSLF